MSADGAEREALERKEIARKVVAQYNAGFIDQQNNTPRPGLVKMIADALEKCANEARLEALEQAAAKVETMKFADGDSWGCFMAPSHEAEELAEAIRALKEAK